MILLRAGLIDEETADRLSSNVDTNFSASQARDFAAFLDGYLLTLPPDGRVLLDGGITTEPDTGELHRDDVERNYTATRAWLADFRDFCARSTGGFTVG